MSVFRSVKHCRHAAGSTAVLAMSVQIVHLPHIMEPLLFGISALLTVYEPLLVADTTPDVINVPDNVGEENDDSF
jgi:hypothetical protein